MSKKILRNKFPRGNCQLLSIMVIGTSTFCSKIKIALQAAHERRKYPYDIFIITCESVVDILDFTNEEHVDFVVFILDTTDNLCVQRVETNIQFMDPSFLCGRTCMVNGTPGAVNQASILNAINCLQEQCSLAFIIGEVMNPDKCLQIAERILTLADSSLTNCSPFIPWLFTQIPESTQK